MDFLKSAIGSAISRGPPFPYNFGDKVDNDDSLWTLCNATKREDGSACSIFSFEVTNLNKNRLPLAKNALRKLRTMRHPGVVKVLDTAETDTYIYIATERVMPLEYFHNRKELQPETIKWGLHAVAGTVKWINSDAGSVHGNLRISSVYATQSGEWKLFGFDVMSSMKEDTPFINTYGSLVPDSSRYAPPEVAKGGWGNVTAQSIPAVDSWYFAILMYELFCGPFSNSEQLATPKGIPSPMVPAYKRLISPAPKQRLPVAQLLDQGKRNGSYFDTPLIRITEFIENMSVKSEFERKEFLSELDEVTDKFPEGYLTMKVLPELLKSIEFGGAGPEVFGTALKISAPLTPEEWQASVSPCVLRMFASPDRQTRLLLLNNLQTIVDHLPDRVINDKVFPEMLVGFSDTEPLLRDTSVKSVLIIVPKLSERNKNGELLKYLAKTQNDTEPGIRTNTTVCIGKIAPHLGTNTRAKVLIAAFGRALRDPFVHARTAALQSLSSSVSYFTETDIANNIIAGLAPSLIDKEKVIRDQAKKTLDQYLTRLAELTASYPDTVLPPPSASPTTIPGSLPASAPTTASTAGAWAGWAVSTFAQKITTVSGGMESATSPPPPPPGPQISLIPGTQPPPSSSAFSSSRPTPSATHSAPHIPIVEPDDTEIDTDAWGAMDEEIDEEGIFAEKKKSSALPKGLTKKAPAVMPVRKTVVAAPRKPLVLGKKKEEKKEEKKRGDWGLEMDDDVGDGWGDGW